jgi:hypothetical protein
MFQDGEGYSRDEVPACVTMTELGISWYLKTPSPK